ncbi:cytochrome P450 [Streptomyces sp. Ru73]|uniref:cytochrome P450 n=1 Tax=Streptomyces sp. Ru73 TaxID=2080748 RepID=UPI000CDE3285|nr:cytochrome P450 [Streptomyces sp. Ru73]POX39367.1 cytochrome P450 [Streptomyces sp. Ru73]
MTDSTLPLLLKGYAWLPGRRRRNGGAPVRTRLLGKPAIALHGTDAVRFFYDEDHIHRRAALPGPVLDTLFGRGAVHTLDGERHRVRKALFVHLLKDREGIADLTERAAAEWERARADWAGQSQVVLFDAFALLLTRTVCGWAGIALDDDEARRTADDLVAMVDGFATPGPRHWRARRARRRQEERLARRIEEIRRTGPEPAGTGAPTGAALAEVARHHEADGTPLDPHTAAVEILNVIRPTVAVAWFLTFAAHALHRWPEHRAPLAKGDTAYARAFAHELRRFYPFVPFLGGLAARDLEWRGERIEAGTMVLLDVYGQLHDPGLWPRPYTFDPTRFLGAEPGRDDLIPQGGGDVTGGHRCPGEDIVLALLQTLVPLLARLEYRVPGQDLSVPLERVPSTVGGGFFVTDMH